MFSRMTQDQGLAKSIEIAGGVSALAAKLGISHQAVSQWCEVPIDRVIQVEAATGIPREELRPDFFAAPRPRKRPPKNP